MLVPDVERRIKCIEYAIRTAEAKPTAYTDNLSEMTSDLIATARKLEKYIQDQS